MRRIYISLIITCLSAVAMAAQSRVGTTDVDVDGFVVDSVAKTENIGAKMASTPVEATDTVTAENKNIVGRVKNIGFVQKVINYFGEANKPHPEKRLDISFIGGPHYSSETGFGIGLAGSGTYYTRRDSAGMPTADTPASNVMLKADVTTGQMYKIGAEGYHIFPGDKWRANYDGYFYSFKDKFWGIGYENGRNDENESTYTRLQARIKADFVYQVCRNVFIGPLGQFSYIKATKVHNPALFNGEQLRTFTTGLGFTFLIDSRDVPTNAYSGIYLRYDQLFNPRFMGNTYAFSSSELTLAGYSQVWKGGVLAAMFHANFTYGNTPWGMLATFGGSSNMRGYYEGRYRDKSCMDFTVELRQHVWRRNGIVLWAGAGEVFPRFSQFKWNHVLPNFGVGYRWEFKHRVNVRLDIGFGKGEKSFNFSLNEAF